MNRSDTSSSEESFHLEHGSEDELPTAMETVTWGNPFDLTQLMDLDTTGIITGYSTLIRKLEYGDITSELGSTFQVGGQSFTLTADNGQEIQPYETLAELLPANTLQDGTCLISAQQLLQTLRKMQATGTHLLVPRGATPNRSSQTFAIGQTPTPKNMALSLLTHQLSAIDLERSGSKRSQ